MGRASMVAGSVLVSALAAWLVACTGPPALSDPAEIAAAYAAAGRYPEAAREVDIAVRADPGALELRRQAARIHEQAGHLESAIGHLEAAIQIAPEDAESWIRLGELEKARQNVADAYVAYRRAAELAPEQIRAVAGLALTADSLGFEDEAEAAYARWADLERTQQQVPATAPPANGE